MDGGEMQGLLMGVLRQIDNETVVRYYQFGSHTVEPRACTHIAGIEVTSDDVVDDVGSGRGDVCWTAGQVGAYGVARDPL